ncbi:MAG: NAD(P)/FAD-dependent oxidoreductase [Lachnospiraceae bacterium]|nr:NAD(P)/FAD-dependent oxidoreductase [Lachnospiraceae bacterium]
MYDVAIVGAGVVGCAIARELSRYAVKACVIERGEDVCTGTSKANSAIVHGGFDAHPGTLKAKLNVEGNNMMDQLAEELDFPFTRNGSLVVCTKDQDPARLEELKKQGEENGVPDLRIIEKAELMAMEPNLADDVEKALYVPTGGIVCPFLMTVAYAENAVTNGVEFIFNTEVKKVEKKNDHYEISINGDAIEAKIVVNAAGVYADELNNMVSTRKLHITARRGQYCLLDHTAGDYVAHTIFQLPGKMGKGVLVTPTVHGNLLVGPTAEDIDDKEGVNTTGDGLSSLYGTAALSVKNVPMREVITSFAGLRAHEDGGDFVIGWAEGADGFYNAAGIESPGLSSAPAIGVMAAQDVVRKLGATVKEDFVAKREGIAHPNEMTMEERNELIRREPAYGQIICRCESVSEGEIIEAIRRKPGATTLDGVKRRVRAGMGRCQAGFCSPRVMEILERELGQSPFDTRKNGADSQIVYGYNKKI